MNTCRSFLWGGRLDRVRPALVAASALFASAAILGPVAARADGYQYIIADAPAGAGTVGSHSAASSAMPLDGGSPPAASSSSALEARFRTWMESVLRSKFNSFKHLGLFIYAL